MMATQLYLKRVRTAGFISYALVDQDGDPLPAQAKTSLVSTSSENSVLSVDFYAGMHWGIRVIDDGDEDAQAS